MTLILQPQTPQRHPILPPDIGEKIIRFYSFESPSVLSQYSWFVCAATLQACTLTCKAWRSVAQNLLFRHVALFDTINLHRFLYALRISPQLGEWVTVLEIWLPRGSGAGGHVLEPHVGLVQLADRLTNLKQIYLNGNALSAPPRFPLHPEFYPSVTILRLYQVWPSTPRDLICLIALFPNLKHIDANSLVDLVEPKKSGTFPSVRNVQLRGCPKSRPRLSTLRLIVSRDNHTLLNWLSLPPSDATLRKIWFTLDESYVSGTVTESMNGLFRICGPAVHECVISYRMSSQAIISSWQLSDLSLSLIPHVTRVHFLNIPQVFIPQLVTALSDVNGMVEEITVLINLQREPVNIAQWLLLFSALEGSSNLRRVTVDVVGALIGKPSEPWTMIQGHLPQLYAAGVLHTGIPGMRLWHSWLGWEN